MANTSSPILPVARECDEILYLGAVGGAMRGTKRGGDLWLVIHRTAGDGIWSHVYRSDVRSERTFHLERVAPGDARSALISWANSAFAIDDAEAEAA